MVTNIEVKMGVNIILNIVHLIVLARSDILLFHGTWLKEFQGCCYCYISKSSELMRISLFSRSWQASFLLVFRNSFNFSKRIVSKILNYDCFFKFEAEKWCFIRMTVSLFYTNCSFCLRYLLSELNHTSWFANIITSVLWISILQHQNI